MYAKRIILAEKIVLERDDLSASAITIVDGIEVALPSEMIKSGNYPQAIGAQLVLLVTWIADDEREANKTMEFTFQIRKNSKRFNLGFAEPLEVPFGGKKNCHTRLRVLYLPFDGPGVYRYEVGWIRKGRKQTIHWPLEVSVKAADARQTAKPKPKRTRT